MNHKTTIERVKHLTNGSDADVEIQIEVTYTPRPAIRGHRDKYGAPEEPDEPAHCEIESVIELETGIDIELTAHEEERIAIEISEAIADAKNDYPEPEDPSF
jgi:hypothetical protein